MPRPKELFAEKCVLTGDMFETRTPNHYERNDGVPFAPPVDGPRPTIRQRVENLLNRGVDPLAHYVGSDDYEMDIPDDPEAELTQSEINYMDAVAASLAESAPLPDDGLPRPSQTSPQAPQAAPEGVSSPPQASDPAPASAPAISTVPSR